MNTELVRQSTLEALGGFDAQEIIDLVSRAGKPADVNDVRARVAAAKAWAKVHNKAKETRLALLRIEIAALKRLGELEAFDGLSAAEVDAARWLSSASDEEVSEAIDRAATATTASGVVRKAKEFEQVRERYNAGYSYGLNPRAPERDEGFAGNTDYELDAAYHEVPAITAIMNTIIAESTEASVPFTVDEVAEAVLSEAGIRSTDQAFLDGVRRACRQAISSSVPKKLGNTTIPRFITCRLDDGQYVRIPCVNAKLPHLDDMIAIRAEQLQRDHAAIKRLMKIRDRLDGLLNGRSRSDTPIGKLLLQVEES